MLSCTDYRFQHFLAHTSLFYCSFLIKTSRNLVFYTKKIIYFNCYNEIATTFPGSDIVSKHGAHRNYIILDSLGQYPKLQCENIAQC